MPARLENHTPHQFRIPTEVLGKLKKEAAVRYTTLNQLVKDILVDWVKNNIKQE